MTRSVQNSGGNQDQFESGVFLVDKPCGPSSFKMVQIIRRALGIKKVGHSGTLDPFANGLLIICAGRTATKLIPRLMDGEKEYHAILRLGVETDTHDTEGQIIAESPVLDSQKEYIDDCLADFMGKQLQKPPMFSALKYKGKPLYYYARKGVKIERQRRVIEIKELECLGFDDSSLTIRVLCSKGTYIRKLAADIGDKIGCGAHLIALRRTKNGIFDVQNSLSGEELQDALFGDRKALLVKHHMSVSKVLEMLNQFV